MSGFFNTFKKATESSHKEEEPDDSKESVRFKLQPGAGESDFAEWTAAMKMVTQLPGGIPSEFRRHLWISLADRHLTLKNVKWETVEQNCFSEWSHPDDAELGVQIVKDLHRTGCSLFCGEDGQENQALLKRVLLAYARWNKAVGYCQGFNMLAALILQVTDKCETDALKLMIYLIEGVLPESYFADNLRGLSVDMAVFRELLRTRLPRLSRHLDTLQNDSKKGTTNYEPPLTNVFTMQWFLTLFCNCLPQPTVLRIWDLILIEGNEILLRTALAIWNILSDKIMNVRSADEFYCIMGALTGELLESNLIDCNSLIKLVVTIGPLTELKSLREHYMYNINPWGTTTVLPQSSTSETDKQLKVYPKEHLILDISALKKQYNKLKQRQRQAHIIFSAAISRQPPSSAPVAMNHLLLGKSALVPAKRLGPPKGSIPPIRQPLFTTTLQWKDTPKTSTSSSSSDTELCDDPSSSDSDTDNNIKDENTDNRISNDNTIKTENIFNNTTTSSKSDNIEEMDQMGIEFENFLKDRIDSHNDSEKNQITLPRRHSERALQIIQENSLILHRIMQCQSRLSPPTTSFISDEEINKNTGGYSGYSTEQLPSLINVDLNENISMKQDDSKLNLIQNNIKLINEENQLSDINSKYWDLLKFDDDKDGNKDTASFNLDISTNVNEEIFVEKSDDYSPISISDEPQSSYDYGSKYTSILEKSKNLDERYKNLFSKSGHELNLVDVKIKTCSEFLSDSSISSLKSSSNEEKCEKFSDEESLKQFEKLNFSRELESKFDDSDSKNLDNLKSNIFNDNLNDTNKFKYKSFSPIDEEKINEIKYRFYKAQELSKINVSPIKNETCSFSKTYSPTKLSNYSFTKEQEETQNIQINNNDNIIETPSYSFTSKFISIYTDDNNSTSPKKVSQLNYYLSSPDEKIEETIMKLSPTKDEQTDTDTSPSKSPSKIFSPFPTNFSTRQNKEVPFKLGLYKKL